MYEKKLLLKGYLKINKFPVSLRPVTSLLSAFFPA